MDEKIIDVDYKEAKAEDEINGKPLYFYTSQVASRLNETDSTVRFWCSKFKDILNIEMTGSHRRFKEEDIEKLKFIKKLLREDNFSIQQVQEYISVKDTSIVERQVEKQEPLAMQVLARAIAIEVGGDLEDFKLMVKNQLIDELRNNKEEIKEYIAVSVSEEIENKLDSKLSDLKTYFDTKELEAKSRDTEMLDLMKNNMEKRKEESQKDKGFFKKVFGK